MRSKKSKLYLANDPAREVVHLSHHHPVGYHNSPKMGGLVPCESLLEMDFAALIEADPRISELFGQPETITYPAEEGRMRKATPDFLIVRDGQQIIVEVKPESKLAPEVVAKFNRLAAEYEPDGVLFELWTDTMIRRQPRLDNSKILLRYPRTQLDDATAKQIVAMVADGPVPMQALTDQLGGHATGFPLLTAAVIKGFVTFDIDQPLAAQTLFFKKEF